MDMRELKPKKTLWIYVGTGAFLLFGITCIICGYGLSEGWDWVAKWFTSQWAIYVYVFIFFYLVGIAWLWIWGRNNGRE